MLQAGKRTFEAAQKQAGELRAVCNENTHEEVSTSRGHGVSLFEIFRKVPPLPDWFLSCVIWPRLMKAERILWANRILCGQSL